MAPAIAKCINGRGKALFMVRDPRDVLVSQYYSFGFTHGISNEPGIRTSQNEIRQKIKTTSLDEYCLSFAKRTEEEFLKLRQLADMYPADCL